MPEPAQNILPNTPQPQTTPAISFNALMAQVQELKSKNEWNHILAILYPLEEKHPELAQDQHAHQLLAEAAFALSQLHRFDEAIKLLERCLDLYPDYYLYLSGIAFNYYNCLMCEKSREIKLGNRSQEYWDKADAAFQRAEQAFPENVVDYYRHGMLYHALAQNNDKKAIPYFLKAIENWEVMEPEAKKARHKDFKNYIKALYHLAKAYLNLDQPEKALDAIQRCIREDEGTHHEEPVHKFYIAGCAYAANKQYEEAVKFLRVAAHQKTKRPKDYVYVAIARVLMLMKDYDGACTWLERTPPKYRKPYALRLNAEIFALMGKTAQAEQLFRDALSRDRQGRHKTLLAWGMMYYRQKKYNVALNYFERANGERRKAFAGEYAEALYYYGLCCREMGKKEKAVEAFQRVLTLDDRHHEAARALRALKPSQDTTEEDGFEFDEEAYQYVRDDIYESEFRKT